MCIYTHPRNYNEQETQHWIRRCNKKTTGRHPIFKKQNTSKTAQTGQSTSYTLQGINISHLGKRKLIFKMPFLGYMLIPWRVNIIFAKIPIAFHQITRHPLFQQTSMATTAAKSHSHPRTAARLSLANLRWCKNSSNRCVSLWKIVLPVITSGFHEFRMMMTPWLNVQHEYM